MLKVKELSSYYGQICALDRISLTVNLHEAVAVIGANGAGKSTLLKTIMGQIRPKNGEIILNDTVLNRLSTHRIVNRGMTLVPEGRQVFPLLTVWDNLLLGGYSLNHKDRLQRLEEETEHFPILRQRKNQLAGLMSGGEQQMLAIARAMMTRPDILLLDEPSMGLSPKMVLNVYEKIAELQNRGTTILLVDQNAEMALNLCVRGYVLMAGRLVGEGSRSELTNSEIIHRSYLG
jgi:branched-chain amino acid transport system ATP-binding protein